MPIRNADEIIAGMVSLLEESGVLEKTASAKEGASELDAIAGSLMTIADQLDLVGAKAAAGRLDEALARLAQAGCKPEVAEAGAEPEADEEIVLKAAATTLVRIADRLDEMDIEALQDVDGAIEALAAFMDKMARPPWRLRRLNPKEANCRCSCDGCRKDMHCGDNQRGCFVEKGRRFIGDFK